MDRDKKISTYENYFSYGPSLKWIYMPEPIHILPTAGQLQEIKGKGIKGGDTNVHCCTHPHKKRMLSLRRQVV